MVKKRIALVRESDGAVVNVCVWDGVSAWTDNLPGVIGIACPDSVGPGHSYLMGEWVAPPPVEQVDEVPVEQTDEPPAEG